MAPTARPMESVMKRPQSSLRRPRQIISCARVKMPKVRQRIGPMSGDTSMLATTVVLLSVTRPMDAISAAAMVIATKLNVRCDCESIASYTSVMLSRSLHWYRRLRGPASCAYVEMRGCVLSRLSTSIVPKLTPTPRPSSRRSTPPTCLSGVLNESMRQLRPA